MKLSQITTQQIKLLSDQQLNSIVFGGEGADNVTDSGCADVALLLGTRPDIAKERAEAAAELYLGGRVRHIIPTGGVEWETDGRTVSEARYMADILCSLGVPEDAITLEEEARTTKENMICSTLQINRRLRLQHTKTCMIVTSASHLRRSLALAKLLLPRSMTISGFAAGCASATPRETLLSEAELMHGLIEHGLIEDIEY